MLAIAATRHMFNKLLGQLYNCLQGSALQERQSVPVDQCCRVSLFEGKRCEQLRRSATEQR